MVQTRSQCRFIEKSGNIPVQISSPNEYRSMVSCPNQYAMTSSFAGSTIQCSRTPAVRYLKCYVKSSLGLLPGETRRTVPPAASFTHPHASRQPPRCSRQTAGYTPRRSRLHPAARLPDTAPFSFGIPWFAVKPPAHPRPRSIPAHAQRNSRPRFPSQTPG